MIPTQNITVRCLAGVYFRDFRLWDHHFFVLYLIRCLISHDSWWWHLKMLKIDLFVNIDHVMHFGALCGATIVLRRIQKTKSVAELWNKDRRIINNTKQQVKFCGSLNYSRGRSRHKQSCSFCMLLGMFVCSYMVFFPFQNILGSSLACSSLLSALWPLWSYTDFHEVLEREGSCKLILPPLRVKRAFIRTNADVLTSHRLRPSRTERHVGVTRPKETFHWSDHQLDVYIKRWSHATQFIFEYPTYHTQRWDSLQTVLEQDGIFPEMCLTKHLFQVCKFIFLFEEIVKRLLYD